ncbi:hypothetical protein DYB37_001803 [Aphanomyces astaci]|uniref:START domain-containing protein n=1 Tax=Aphanomyces astaci TaxID=112090 RepID=A0A3R6XY87_APHAT|nr:hypothetical protein DYB35_000137 [Aphanomyces astaci]RHZ16049.1 hypothetical protein DYB37_001803 [Aphanomyces astaci]
MGHVFSTSRDSFNSLRSTGRQTSSARSAMSSRFTSQKSTRNISIREARPTIAGDGMKPAPAMCQPSLIPTSPSEPPADSTSPLVQISVDIRRHSMTGHGAFRGDTYEFLLRQLQPKLALAVHCIHSYVDDKVSDQPHLFVAPDYVDYVCHRAWPVPLNRLANVLWTVMTDMPSHAVRKTKVLDTKGHDLSYVEVRIESGHRRNVPVVVNVLYQRKVSADGVTIVYRTINEDDQFPVPVQTVHVGLSGWIVLKRGDDNDATCIEQTFVRFRLSNVIGLNRNQWLAGIMQKWFRAEATALKIQLQLDV